MSKLHDAILDLRVRVLSRIAGRRRFESDEAAIRDLAVNMRDADVMAELRRQSSAIRRIFRFFQRHIPG